MSSLLRSLARPATAPIRRWVLGAFPRGQSGIDYDHPLGDPGWFGPDSITWRVHSEFPGMLAGGLCALMLQTLHPLALAGVYDHSNFRDDLVGRLRRTTAFVAGTTYAPAAEVEALIAKVTRIHAQVRGHTADGRAYSADDPALLTWVHVTEAYGFLQGCRRYCRDVPGAIADQYYREYKRVAEALGATDVPASEAEVDAYFAQQQSALVFDARSREVLAVLSGELFLGAGAALLPDWATTMLARTPMQRAQSRASAVMLKGMAPLFRRALQDGLATRACTRMGVPAGVLADWP
jgi:uncharacterized protein (DUF2236 family)